jgi:hypothetical protein
MKRPLAAGPRIRNQEPTMKKLTLNPEALQVDSFETAEHVRENGTAQRAWSDDSVCPTTAASERHPCY